jgi:membrane protein implicated in regulation of membrane protease activity
MEVVPGNDITWSTFYLGLSVFSLSLVGAVAVGAYPFSVLSTTQVAVFSSLLFVVASVVHVRWTRRRRLGSPGRPPTRRV